VLTGGMDDIPRPTVLREQLIELIDRLFNRAWLLRLLLAAYIWESTLKSLDIAMT